MGKKKTLSLSSLLLMKSSSFSWPWPSCHQPRTLSFRANNIKDSSNTFKTINNSAYLDATIDILETSQSFFTNSAATFSTEDESTKLESFETAIRGTLPSDRFFFEPDETNSILESNKSPSAAEESTETLPFKDSVVLSMESQDPYVDFRKSMEEMVAAHQVKDWECLQELLCWYLRVNEKSNHGYIVGAFVDLLVALAYASANSSSSFSNSSSTCSFSPSSPLSFYSSSMSSFHCVSCLDVVVDDSPSSSFLLEQVSEEIDREDEALSLCSSSTST